MNCPECDAPQLVPGIPCRKCGWGQPAAKASSGPKPWEPEPFTPPTEAEREALRGLIASTAASLGAEPKAERRTPMSSQPKRCPKCETGNFVHMGVRYCLDGYLGRHR